VNKRQLIDLLPPVIGRVQMLKKNQGTGNIIRAMINKHKAHANDYLKIAGKFCTGNVLSTAQNIFYFLKSNVPYDQETLDEQTVKSPAAILTNALKGGTDCKHYSLFIGGVLDACSRITGKKINWVYRFVSYHLFDPVPHHVFVVINPGTSMEIWVDPVLPTFNERKQYFFKKDEKILGMPLYEISGQGIGTTFFGNIFKGIVKAGKVVLSVGAIPARNAFLALVGLNVHFLATTLAKHLLVPADRQKMYNIWSTLGGHWAALTGTIGTGNQKKGLFGIGSYNDFYLKSSISGLQSVGFAPAAIPGLLAAASPIIAAFGAFLTDIKNNQPLQAGVSSAVQTIQSNAQAQLPTPPYGSGETVTPSSDPNIAYNVNLPGVTVTSSPLSAIPTPVLLGGAGVILLLLLNSKKHGLHAA